MQIDIDIAYSYCKNLAKKHYENFPVGSLLIPSDKRKYIYSIYAFARTADDVADSDTFSKEEKLRLLNEYENELTNIELNRSVSLNKEAKNIFTALSNTIEELKIPVQEFRDLLTAFKQDAVKQRYDNFDELLNYSHYSADPVGHLVLYVFGYNPVKDKKCFEYSDKVCTALQLTNFWQDVSEDLKIGRIYIPDNTMREFNYSEKMLFEKTENDDFRKIISHLSERTNTLFEEGKKITELVSGRLKYELKATIAGGLEILRKIEKINYNVLSQRVTISKTDKFKLLGKIFSK
ncbi:MAG TPA: squalene synthase HpnC [Ignavibacteria bacterium]|nr:squalene synthase HpnC [Ignavibacteria bacterium]